MAELIDQSNYQDFTLATLSTPDGITRFNNIIRQLAQNISSDTESVKVYQGVGTPEASIAAGIGSLYMRTDGSADTAVYRKESGSGNTGWVAVKSPASLPLSVANGGFGADNSSVLQGYIPYMSATGTISWLAVGTSGQSLQTQGSSANPIWNNSSLQLISTTTVSGAASTGNISLTSGKSYKIIIKGSLSNAGEDLWLRFNADSSTVYRYIRGGYTGAADAANTLTTGASKIIPNTATLSTDAFALTMDFIPDNADTKFKMVIGDISFQANAGNEGMGHFVAHYIGSANITSFVLSASVNNISATVWTYEYSGT